MERVAHEVESAIERARVSAMPANSAGARNVPPGSAVAGAQIERAGWDKVSFAWAGGIEKGQGHYYRLQGPTFVLEYDNTQNNANHIHTVWRDFLNDFGEDALKKHYQSGHHAHLGE